MKLTLLCLLILATLVATASAHRRPGCRRRGFWGTLRCRFWRRRKPTCPEMPSTGCFQSSNVQFTPVSFGSNNPDWTWTDDGIDYGRPVEYPSAGYNTYAMCIYDGLAVDQSETEAPQLAEDGSSSLLLAGLTNFLGFLVVDEPNGVIKYEYGLSSWTYHLLSSSQRANTITQLISVEDGDFRCWGKDVSLVFSPGAQVIDPDTKLGSSGSPVGGHFDALSNLQYAARAYNAFSEDQALDTEEFLVQNGPAYITQKLIELGDANAEGEFSAIYAFGQYAAQIVLYSVFNGGQPAPAFEPSTLAQVNGLVNLRNIIISDLVSLQNLADTNFKTPFTVGTTLPSLSSPTTLFPLFGYILGYQQGIIQLGDQVDVLTPIEPDMIVCPVYDDNVFPITVPVVSGTTAAQLVPCVYDEDVFDESVFGTLGTQEAIRDSFVTNFPTEAGYDLASQDAGYEAGWDFYELQQIDQLLAAEEEFPTLYSFGNGQLQLINAAITAGMTAVESGSDLSAFQDFSNAYTAAFLFRRSFEEGIEYLLDNSVTLELPTWDFGTTPVV